MSSNSFASRPPVGGEFGLEYTETLADSRSRYIYQVLSADIQRGNIKPGTRLRQGEIAKRYKVSITPVREAFALLGSDGFVDNKPYVGTIVHVPTLKEVDDVYEFRRELVPIIARSAVPAITDEALEAAEALVNEMEGGPRAGSWSQTNVKFHRILDEACENRQVLGTATWLANLSRVYVSLSMLADDGRRTRAESEHRELIDSYWAHDIARVVAATLEHLSTTHEIVRAYILSAGD